MMPRLPKLVMLPISVGMVPFTRQSPAKRFSAQTNKHCQIVCAPVSFMLAYHVTDSMAQSNVPIFVSLPISVGIVPVNNVEVISSAAFLRSKK